MTADAPDESTGSSVLGLSRARTHVGGTELTVLTGYDDCAHALRTNDLGSDPSLYTGIDSTFYKALGLNGQSRPSANLLLMDDPDHRRFRSVLSPFFTAAACEERRPAVEAMSHEILAAAKRKRVVDIVDDIATPFAASVIGSIVGIPAVDVDQIESWLAHVTDLLDPDADRDLVLRARRGALRGLQYTSRLLRQPDRIPPGSVMATLPALLADGAISKDEYLTTPLMLLHGGLENSVAFLTAAVVALVDHPTQLDQMASETADTRTAVEELLRYCSPTHATVRAARCPTTVGSSSVDAGQPVAVGLASGNRDGDRFARPDDLDLGRQMDVPHLAFGLGSHYCIGASLARIEAQVLLGDLVSQFPRMQLIGTPTSEVRSLGEEPHSSTTTIYRDVTVDLTP